MEKIISGKVYKFGNNIDTDIISPGMTISFGLADGSELEEVRLHAFEELRPGFYKEVIPGSIMVAGKNFGLGSHREQATTVMKKLGFTLVIADSVARLYQRNSFAIGFPVLEVPGISRMVEEGDYIDVDLYNWTLMNKKNNETIKIEPLSEIALKIIYSGGIIELLKETWKQMHH